jgi:hypothetical protein
MKHPIIILALTIALAATATTAPVDNVKANPNTGALVAPSNFWTGNSAAIGSALSATYQPLDSDLTSIAALATTTYGRSLLTQADAAAARGTLGAVGYSSQPVSISSASPQTIVLGGGVSLGGQLTTAGDLTADGAVTFTGAHSLQMRLTGATDVTLPTSGTLAGVAANQTFSGSNNFSGPFTVAGLTLRENKLAMDRDESVWFMPNLLTRAAAVQAWNATAGPIGVLVVGDSLSVGLAESLRAPLQRIYGYGGTGLSTGAVGSTASNAGTLAGGTTQVTGADTIWPTGNYFSVPSGGSVIFGRRRSITAGINPELSSVITVAYIKESGAGTFKVQTSTDGGATWSDEAGFTSIDASNATTIGAVAKITKSINSHLVKIVGLTGTVKIIGTALNDATTPGVIIHSLSQGSWDLVNFNATPTAITTPILSELGGIDVVIYRNIGNAAAQSAGLTTLYTNIRAADGTNDWIFWAVNDTASQNAEEENAVIRAFAVSQNQSYFDDRSWGVSYATRVALGLMADETHPNGASERVSMQRLMSRSPLGGYGSALAPGSPTRRQEWIDTDLGVTTSGPKVGFTNPFPGPFGEGRLNFVISKWKNAMGRIAIESYPSFARAFAVETLPGDHARANEVRMEGASAVPFLRVQQYGLMRYGAAGDNAPSQASHEFEWAGYANPTMRISGSYLDTYDTVAFYDNANSVKQAGIDYYGNFVAYRAGTGIKIKEGSNAKMGTATLASGTATVATTAVSGSSRIQLTRAAKNASTGIGSLNIATVNGGTSFVIEALKSDATTETGDLSTVSWLIVDPAP